jgi:small GTP-binding protein
VGVKIDRKALTVRGTEVNLVLWDLRGEDESHQVAMSYLRGCSGYLLVADGTRRVTLDRALSLQASAEGATGKVPFVLALNKMDLAQGWEIEPGAVDRLASLGWVVVRTSAKTGQGVEQAFHALAAGMLER